MYAHMYSIVTMYRQYLRVHLLIRHLPDWWIVYKVLYAMLISVLYLEKPQLLHICNILEYIIELWGDQWS